MSNGPTGVVAVSLKQNTQTHHEVLHEESVPPTEFLEPPDSATPSVKIPTCRSVEVDGLAINVHGSVVVPIGPNGVVDVSLIAVPELGSTRASECGYLSILPAFPSAILR